VCAFCSTREIVFFFIAYSYHILIIKFFMPLKVITYMCGGQKPTFEAMSWMKEDD